MKRVASAVLLVCLLLTCALPAQAVGTFTDVEDNTWYTEAVTYVVEHGYFNGVSETRFAPQTTMTRGMFITVLGRIGNVTQEAPAYGYIHRDSVNLREEPNTSSKVLATLRKGTTMALLGQSDDWYRVQVGEETGYIRGDLMKLSGGPYTDVPAEQYYAPYIRWAYEHGIAWGTSATQFSPDEPITREDLCTALYLFSVEYKVSFSAVNEQSQFADDAEISDYAKIAVYTMQMIGVIEGRENNLFAPKAGAKRAEVAAILKRYADAIGQEKIPDASIRFGVPVPESAAVPDGYFDDACFIGHSIVVGMSNYFRLANTDYYAVSGVSASWLLNNPYFKLEKTEKNEDGKEVNVLGTLAEALAEKAGKYKKVYIMLGTNELGAEDSHLRQYAASMEAIIDLVRESQPDATIYLMSTLPVTEQRSEKDEHFNRENVLAFNERLKQISVEKEAYYVDTFSALADDNGYLPEGSCLSDGIHILSAQYAALKTYLKKHTV